jgi:hypothetical protein
MAKDEIALLNVCSYSTESKQSSKTWPLLNRVLTDRVAVDQSP